MGVRSHDHQKVGGKQYFDSEVQFNGQLHGVKQEVYTAVDGETLPAEKSGALVILGTAIDVKLPKPELGLNYKFIFTADLATTDATVISTSDGSTETDMFTGTLDLATAGPVQNINQGKLTFVKNKIKEGDFCEVTCISESTSANPVWHFYGTSPTAAAITLT